MVKENALQRSLTKNRMIIILCFFMLGLGIVIRIGDAFWTTTPIDFDENFYASQISTYLETNQLYTAITGYPPMEVVPGRGIFFHVYTPLVAAFGFNILMLRGVAALLFVVGLGGIYMLARLLYDNLTALVTLAIASVSAFMVQSASIRLDAMTIAYVAWGCVFTVYTLKHNTAAWLVAGVGLYMGLGLHAHIDTLFVAFGCGLLYLVLDIQNWRHADQRSFWAINYALGYGVGLSTFVVYAVLPDPNTFFTVLFNVRSIESQALGTTTQGASPFSNIIGLLFNPIEWLARLGFMVLWTQFYGTIIEAILLVSALLAVFWRQGPGDTHLRWLVLGSVVCAVFVAKSVHFVYFTHIAPPILVAIGAFAMRGFGQVPRAAPPALLALLLGFSVVAHRDSLGHFGHVVRGDIHPPQSIDAVNYIHQHATADDLVAGPVTYYLSYFHGQAYDYIALDEGIYRRAMPLLDIDNVDEYWRTKDPDFFILDLLNSNVEDNEDVLTFLEQNGYIQVVPTVWVQHTN